ncbi:hypothetical protein NECAME_01468 [Necator americanus]|uniref:Uncharacterized protein n=1 Tax=Necator americanus TaxID=51031 RepID=W2TWX9_NECAM|nr:hypothetical protein NECAME_01468 [Necator americanus]ETN85576.1 hypothetical protein NECAME_01468 [Necator americanus]
MVSTEAAQTFHRVWMLTRNNDDQPPLSTKPFNRAVMLLLGVLADESVTRARTELKSAAAAWFTDCAKHNDLPRIVQVLCLGNFEVEKQTASLIVTSRCLLLC